MFHGFKSILAHMVAHKFLNRDNKIIVMTGEIWISIVALALVLIAIVACYKKGKKPIMNKTMFAVGLIIALVAALMEFCQERCFLRADLEFWPMVLGIVGIGLIATSNYPNYRLLKSKKK